MVPGSIPRMILDAVCKSGLIFTDILLLEQKYQINHQLPDWPLAVCGAYLEPLPANHSAARFGNSVGTY